MFAKICKSEFGLPSAASQSASIADLLRVTDHAATAAYTKVPYFARMPLSGFVLLSIL